MKHLLISREYPPASYPAGGIGTYARHIARLLAEAGETVHVIGQRWDGAPDRVIQSHGGRLVVHRLGLGEDLSAGAAGERELLRMLAWSDCPSHVFAWQAARYAERLIEQEDFDLIEAQEWEAPLYYLQVRRALGLGPTRQPPCLVHLHSPTAMIFEHNGWDRTLVDYVPLSRLEEYSIRAADALVCPSHYLAGGVARMYGMDQKRIDVVRYPMGETEVVTRDVSAWERNAVCYVGRLELRKGVVEWVDAAISVAGGNASVSFDFFGSDTPRDGGAGRSVQALLEGRIPSKMRHRFRFHGAKPREDLMRALAGVSIAVVPSRWENLPFTCIEAMATGLPLLVSPCGGMAELVEDGVSGWIAEDGSSEALASSLLRALAAPAEERARMGARAAERVRALCGNSVVLEAHLKFRRSVVEAGCERSRKVPGSHAEATSGRRGIVWLERGPRPLASRHADMVDLLHRKPQLLGAVLAEGGLVFEECFAAACERVFASQPGVGMVMPWKMMRAKEPEIDAGPCPVSATEMQGELPAGCCLRVEAFLSEGSKVSPLTWETLVLGGWAAVTYPEILAHSGSGDSPVHAPAGKRRYSGMALIQNQTPKFALAWFWAAPLSEKLRWMRRAAGKPGRVFRWLHWQIPGGAK